MVRLVVSLSVAVLLSACASAEQPRVTGDGGLDGPMSDGCTAAPERCNAMDDDCDDKIDEEFPIKGMACATGVGACAADGHWSCTSGGDLACDATAGAPSSESCDGVDNDCDDKIDEDFQVGMPCDGSDADVCADGVIVCTSLTTTTCTDGPDNAPELCDTFDNDCDGSTDEGFNLGAACDGADGDACNEGQIVCATGGGTKCSDTTSNSAEQCNGLDDDCKNGIDDPWPVGQACSVGLGACMRSGTLACNTTTSVACNATAGAPLVELCGNGSDEDCNGADAACPANDLPSGAVDISAGGTFTVDLSAAHDDNWATATGLDCGNQGGRDVFYQFVLPAQEVVYYDTFASSFDSVVRIFPGSCTALGPVATCGDDACTQTRSQGALELAAGTYCLVLDQFSSTTITGAGSLVFRRGARTGTALPNLNGNVTGTTTGKTDLSVAGCEANSHQPDVSYFFTTCPGAHTVSASTCTGTAFDSVIYLRTGAATAGDAACSDDSSGCGSGLQSRITSASVTGANLQWLIVDGFGTSGNGAYTLTYAIQ